MGSSPPAFVSSDTEQGALIGVMGLQDVQDVAQIRHAYALPGRQRSGVGSALHQSSP